MYYCKTKNIGDFDAMGELIRSLCPEPSRAIISGKLKQHIDPTAVTRTKENFEPQPHRWIMLDIDGVEAQSGRTMSELSDEELLAEAVQYLPAEFQQAKCWYHLSSSMGIKPGIRVHLWYWLDRFVSDQEKTAWFSGHHVDLALFNPVQLHLTANPEFIGGDDPYPERFGLYEPERCADTVTVPETFPEASSSRRATAKHVRAGNMIEHAEIIRDEGTGLAVDGRERLLFELSNEVMFDLCRGRNEVPSVHEITERLWQQFQSEADLTHLNERRWSRTDAGAKARKRHAEAISGTYSFRSRSDKIQLRPAPEPTYSQPTVTPHEAQDEMGRALEGFFGQLRRGGFPRLALRLTMGLGKTTQTVAKLKDFLKGETGKLIEVYVPRHDLADEWEAALDSVTAKVIHVRPRTGEHPSCSRPEYVRALEANGIPVFRNACLGAGEAERCTFFTDCQYLKQFRDPPFDFTTNGNIVRIYTHASLGLPRNQFEEERHPDLVVIDESFFSSLVSDFPSIAVEEIRRHIRHDQHTRLGSLISDALSDPDGPGLLVELTEAGITRADLQEVDLSNLRPQVQFDTESNQPPSVTSGKLYNGLQSLLRVITDEFDLLGRNQPARLWYDDEAAQVVVCEQKELRINAKTPLLLLDATADEDLLDALVPFTHVRRIDVKQRAIVTQVYDQTGSNTFWNDSPDKVDALVGVLRAWISSGEKPLLIAHKKLADDIRGRGVEGLSIGHFGGIRGSNAFEGCTVVFITGRNAPPASEVERQARAIFWNGKLPLAFDDTSDFLPLELRGYWQSEWNQFSQSGVLVNAFRDPRIEAVHKQIKEAETIQAIARLRLVWSPVTKYVFMLGNLPVELPVDRFRTSNDMFPDRLEVALLQDRNVPLTPASLNKLRPDICDDYDSARMMLRRSDVVDVRRLDFLPGEMRLLAQKATYKAGEVRRTEHTHIFLPKEIAQSTDDEGILTTVSVAQAADYSEVRDMLEAAWGEGNVHDLRLEPWPLPGAGEGTEDP